jgi:hypothetical protein
MWSWNMNTARIVSSITEWQEDPTTYLAQLGSLAEVAGTQQIVLVLSLANDAGQRHKLPTAAAGVVRYGRYSEDRGRGSVGALRGAAGELRWPGPGGRFPSAELAWERFGSYRRGH